MADKNRKIEIFSASCPACNTVVKQVKDAACPSCDVEVLDMQSLEVQERATTLGIKSVPAVLIDDKLADCCVNRGVDLNVLRSAGLGKAI